MNFLKFCSQTSRARWVQNSRGPNLYSMDGLKNSRIKILTWSSAICHVINVFAPYSGFRVFEVFSTISINRSGRNQNVELKSKPAVCSSLITASINAYLSPLSSNFPFEHSKTQSAWLISYSHQFSIIGRLLDQKTRNRVSSV